jgi:hypothetical protein
MNKLFIFFHSHLFYGVATNNNIYSVSYVSLAWMLFVALFVIMNPDGEQCEIDGHQPGETG